MTSLLVTGATGNIGTALSQMLLAQNISFTAATPNGKGLPGIPTRHLDYADPASVHAALAGVETLFLLIPNAVDMEQWLDTVIAAAQAQRVRHIVRSSGIGADAQSPHLVFHRLGVMEDMLRACGIPITILRPNSFLQNFATFHAAQIQQGLLPKPHADARVSYVDVRDVAAAAAAVLRDPSQHAGQIYTLTGPFAATNTDVLAAIETAGGPSARYLAVSDDDTAAALSQYNMPPLLIEQLISLYRADRAGETALVTDDIQRLTGRAPRTVQQFVADYLDAWQRAV